MSTLFIALQCIQCSTMQVKQRKKSGSNNKKWVCAVCNLRQSVRQVHARGPIARDLRGFVQEFNLSRAVHGSDGSDPIPTLRSSGSRAPDGFGERHKRRMDWSEYLDPHEEEEEEEVGGGRDGGFMDFPPRNFENLSQKRTKQMESFKPNFPNRKQNKEKGSFRGQNSSRSSGMEQKKTLETKVSSKWSEYLEEEEDTSEAFAGEECMEQSSRYYEHHGGKERQPSDLLVADEIHPDFK